MGARIYLPAKTAMQSGKANARQWVLEFEPGAVKTADPLMGWSGSADTNSQVRMTFPSEGAAVAFAERHGLAFEVIRPHLPARKFRAYADNFR